MKLSLSLSIIYCVGFGGEAEGGSYE